MKNPTTKTALTVEAQQSNGQSLKGNRISAPTNSHPSSSYAKKRSITGGPYQQSFRNSVAESKSKSKESSSLASRGLSASYKSLLPSSIPVAIPTASGPSTTSDAKHSPFFHRSDEQKNDQKLKSLKTPQLLNSGLRKFQEQKAVDSRNRARDTGQMATVAPNKPKVIIPITSISTQDSPDPITSNSFGINTELAFDDDIEEITAPQTKTDTRRKSVEYNRQPHTIPKKHRLSIAASWMKTLTASSELVDFKFLEISPGLMELKGSKDYADVILIDEDVSAVLFQYTSDRNKSTRLAITCDGTVYTIYITASFQTSWLHEFVTDESNHSMRKVRQMSEDAASEVEALVVDWIENTMRSSRLNPESRRSSNRVDAMKRKGNHALDELAERRLSKGNGAPIQANVDNFYGPVGTNRRASGSTSRNQDPIDVNSDGLSEDNESGGLGKSRFERLVRRQSNGEKVKKDTKFDDLPAYVPPPPTNEEIFKFPDDGDKFAISVREHDKHRLNPGEFLNDTVIEFCFRYLRQLPDSKANAKFFNSFFYNHLTSNPDTGKFGGGTKSNGWNYKKVETWTKNVDIFKVDFIIVPINEHLHWYLGLIINPGAVLKNLKMPENRLEEIVQIESSSQEEEEVVEAERSSISSTYHTPENDFQSPDMLAPPNDIMDIDDPDFFNTNHHKLTEEVEGGGGGRKNEEIDELESEQHNGDSRRQIQSFAFNGHLSSPTGPVPSAIIGARLPIIISEAGEGQFTRENIYFAPSSPDCSSDIVEIVGGGGRGTNNVDDEITDPSTVSLSSSDNVVVVSNAAYEREDDHIDSDVEIVSEKEMVKKPKAKPVTTQQKKSEGKVKDLDAQIKERQKAEKGKEDEKRRRKDEQAARKKRKEEEDYVFAKDKCCIIVLDSLNVPRVKPYQALRDYLVREALSKKPELFRNGEEVDPAQIVSIKNPNVPVQPNHYDCGVYVIKYVEKILQFPTETTEYLLRKKSNRSSWFTHKDIEKYRESTYSLMDSLTDAYMKNHPEKAIPETPIATEHRLSRRSNGASKKQKVQSGQSSDVIVID